MSMDLALFSQKSASCKTLSIFLLMLKSAGTSCHNGAQDLRFRSAVSKHSCSLIESPAWLKNFIMTHHIMYRAVNPVVLFQKLFYCSGPEIFFIFIFIFPKHSLQNRLEKRWQCLQQAGTHLKAALRVLFLRTKAILTRPSHSFFEGQENTLIIYDISPFWTSCFLTA